MLLAHSCLIHTELHAPLFHNGRLFFVDLEGASFEIHLVSFASPLEWMFLDLCWVLGFLEQTKPIEGLVLAWRGAEGKYLTSLQLLYAIAIKRFRLRVNVTDHSFLLETRSYCVSEGLH